MARNTFLESVWIPNPFDVYTVKDLAQAKKDIRKQLGFRYQTFKRNPTDPNYLDLLEAITDFREAIRKLDQRLEQLRG